MPQTARKQDVAFTVILLIGQKMQEDTMHLIGTYVQLPAADMMRSSGETLFSSLLIFSIEDTLGEE